MKIKLKEVLRQDSVTAALTEIYGAVRLEVLAQQVVESVAPPHDVFFGLVQGPLLERRIRLMVGGDGELSTAIVFATSWIRLEALSAAARDALQQGRRMLGEILAAEEDLGMHDYGLEKGTSWEVCQALELPDDTELIFRWRYWSKTSGERVVLLRECSPAFADAPQATQREALTKQVGQ